MATHLRLQTSSLGCSLERPGATCTDELTYVQATCSLWTNFGYHRSSIAEHHPGSDPAGSSRIIPGNTVIAPLSTGIPQQNHGVIRVVLSSIPASDSKKAGYPELLFSIRTSNSQELFPNPKEQGSTTHRGKAHCASNKPGAYQRRWVSMPLLAHCLSPRAAPECKQSRNWFQSTSSVCCRYVHQLRLLPHREVALHAPEASFESQGSDYQDLHP